MISKTETGAQVRHKSDAGSLPLSALLSFALVAFTIEFDNEAEHRLPHTTTNHKPPDGFARGPWLVSMAMWFNCMKFVNDKGITVGELTNLVGTTTNVDSMRRWGYVEIAGGPVDKKSEAARQRWVLRATPAGRRAQAIWRSLFSEIESRWRERFGAGAIDKLRESLWAMVRQFRWALPDCMPILGYGLWTKDGVLERPAPPDGAAEITSSLSLPALLARALIGLAMAYERESKLSLAITANVVRVLDGEGISLRDLPILSGVSKEAIGMAMGFLRKRDLAIVEPDEIRGRGKLTYLTPNGLLLKKSYAARADAVEKRLGERFGKETIVTLRRALTPLVGDGTREGSPLFRGLEPYPENWRAAVRNPQTLPHYPMVLHRGGYPDGS